MDTDSLPSRNRFRDVNSDADVDNNTDNNTDNDNDTDNDRTNTDTNANADWSYPDLFTDADLYGYTVSGRHTACAGTDCTSNRDQRSRAQLV